MAKVIVGSSVRGNTIGAERVGSNSGQIWLRTDESGKRQRSWNCARECHRLMQSAECRVQSAECRVQYYGTSTTGTTSITTTSATTREFFR